MKKVLLLAVMAMFFISCDTSNPPETADYTFVTILTVSSIPSIQGYPKITKTVSEQKGITLDQAKDVAKSLTTTSKVVSGGYTITSTMVTTYVLSSQYVDEHGAIIIW